MQLVERSGLFRLACAFLNSYKYINTVLKGLPVADFSLKELCAQVDLPIRTVRYYVQIGLLERPTGETRAARYGLQHVEQLSRIKQWTAAGLSLDRVRELLHGDAPDAAAPPVPLRRPVAGSIEVKSHLHLADGVELVLDPARAGLSPTMVRALAQGVARLYAEITGSASTATAAHSAPAAPPPHSRRGQA